MRAHVIVLLISIMMSGGCIKQIAFNALADSFSGDGTSGLGQDDDMEFVMAAVPFAAKLMEMIRDNVPNHPGIHETLCATYTQYAMVAVGWPAEQTKDDDYAAYEAAEIRMQKFLKRSQKSCMASLELRYPGSTDTLHADPQGTLSRVDAKDVSLLYWTGAGWLALISKSKEDMGALAALPIASAFVKRGLELDAAWGGGSFHELSIALEPSSPIPGGIQRAREHFNKAIELNKGTRASTYVSLATSVSIMEQNKEEFISLMNQALSIDPEANPEEMLATIYAQEQAQYYLDHIDNFFME